MNRLALALGVAVALSIPHASVQVSASAATPQSQRLANERLDRMRAWMKATRAHLPGVADEPALTVSALSLIDVSGTLVRVAELVNVIRVANARDAKAGVLRDIDYDGRAYNRAQLLALFQLKPTDRLVADPQEILECGALLHTDIAMLLQYVAAPQAGRIGSFSSRSVLTSDGVVDRADDNPEHWIHARRLLDFVMRAPSDQDREWVRQWYRATTAWQSAVRRWSVADYHLTHARAVFPDDGRLLFYSGVTHEVLAAPVIQAAMERLAGFGGSFNVSNSSSELGRAAAWLGQSTRLDPDFAPGHLHLGRVLGGLGRHEEAVRELTTAAARLTDREQTYEVNLFLGYEQGALGDRDAATAAFERAAAVFPSAQAPLLGLSQLARQFDDAGATHAALDRLLALTADDGRADPWWDYIGSHVRDANQLMDGVRRSLAVRSTQ